MVSGWRIEPFLETRPCKDMTASLCLDGAVREKVEGFEADDA